MWGHPDQVEGPLAFAEKREPRWATIGARSIQPRRVMTENRREGIATVYETLKIERHGPVGWLINNRPERLNAMNNAMRDEFAEAWKELDADPAVRVIVHTGEGKAFQTGADMIEIASDGVGFERYRESSEKFDFHFTSWHNDVWKPVITAVNGICAGGGFHWIADADIVHRGVRRHVPRPPCVGGAGGRVRADRTGPAHALRGGPAHGAGRTARAHVGRTRAGPGHDQPGGRPTRAPA